MPKLIQTFRLNQTAHNLPQTTISKSSIFSLLSNSSQPVEKNLKKRGPKPETEFEINA